MSSLASAQVAELECRRESQYDCGSEIELFGNPVGFQIRGLAMGGPPGSSHPMKSLKFFINDNQIAQCTTNYSASFDDRCISNDYGYHTLTPGQYTFKMSATWFSGITGQTLATAWDEVIVIVRDTPPPITNVHVANLGSTDVTPRVSWTSVTNVSHYNIYRCTYTGPYPYSVCEHRADGLPDATVPSNTTAWVDPDNCLATTKEATKEMHYKVTYVRNGYESWWSNPSERSHYKPMGKFGCPSVE